MRRCLGCLGDGCHDFREEEEELRLTEPALYERMLVAGAIKGVVRCDRCNGSGEMTDEEYERVLAESREWVSPIIERAVKAHRDRELRRFL